MLIKALHLTSRYLLISSEASGLNSNRQWKKRSIFGYVSKNGYGTPNLDTNAPNLDTKRKQPGAKSLQCYLKNRYFSKYYYQFCIDSM